MNAEEIFDRWAPDDAAWSDWARPALFIGLGELRQVPAAVPTQSPWSPDVLPLTHDTALVLELPGHLGLELGLALAELGRRPVPVINTTWGTQAALDLTPHLAWLLHGAERLERLSLPPDAPPTFILDAARLAPGWVPRPRLYDNRWLVAPQDFPSAAHLKAAGLRRVVVARPAGAPALEDLDHVLYRFKEAGLELLCCDESGQIAPLEPVRPGGLRSLLRRATSLIGFSTNSAGGFGSRIPEPSQGGHG
jgi:hypothetical protein